MSQDDFHSDSNWERLFARLEVEPTEMDEGFQRELAANTARVFASKQKKSSRMVAFALGALALAASLAALAFFVERPTKTDRPVDTRVVASSAPNVVGASCWNLRSAWEDSEVALAEALDEQMATRRSRNNIRWSSDLFLVTGGEE